jgi:S1/P1 Nuclease
VKRFLVTLIALASIASSSAQAWNAKGHMTVARIAWNELTPDERKKVIEILKSHPHYEDFLKAQRPDNIPEDEWVFLQAAVWADWVRSGAADRRKYNVPERHYINLPIVAEGSGITPPKPKDENVVNGITKCLKDAKMGTNQVDRAIAVTWLFHLVGDIEQPLHSVARFDTNFPNGDQGGNKAVVRISGGGTVHLHQFWDGLLGNSTTRTSILGTVKEAEELAEENKDVIKTDLEKNKTPEAWAKESSEQALKYVYEEGKLKPANVDDNPDASAIPKTSDDYAKTAGKMARLYAYKGGKRLAQMLREVIATN